MSFVQGETQQGDFLLCLFACGPGTQGDDAEGQVASQFLQQPNLFRCKSVGLGGINVKTAEGVGLFVLERQGDGGTKTVLQSALPPWRDSRIRCVILNAASFPAPDGRSAGAAPTLRVGPSDAEVCEISSSVPVHATGRTLLASSCSA